MPWGDGTGPMGLGAMTGRAAGYCAGYPVPGFMNPWGGRFGFGLGRGLGRWEVAPSWYYGAGYYPSIPNYPVFPYYTTTSEQEMRILKNEAKNLKNALKEIQERIDELEKEKAEGKS